MSKSQKNTQKNGHILSFDNDIYSINQSEKIPIFNKDESKLSEEYGITSEELENLASSYNDTNNKLSILENIEILGGTKGILQKLKTSAE